MRNYDPRLYFAYGSNLHIDQMVQRCPTAVPVRKLLINNWRLVFRGVADIEPSPGDIVYGALYQVTPADVEALDRYEGVKAKLYRQVDFTVMIRGVKTKCFFYRMNDDYIYPPEDYYYDIIAQGFDNWSLPIDALVGALRESWDVYEHNEEAFSELDLDDIFADDPRALGVEPTGDWAWAEKQPRDNDWHCPF